MSVALIADAHVSNHRRWGGPVEGGLNVRGRECVDTLRRASLMAAEMQCAALFVLGDLFDSTRPSPALVAATLGALTAGGRPVHVLLGNHDRQSQHPNDQACASMDYVDGVTVHAATTTVIEFPRINVVVIPYQPGEAKDWLPTELASQVTSLDRHRRTILLTHLGIWDESTPTFLKAARDAVGLGQVRWLLDAHGIDAFFAGNWHQARSWRAVDPGPGSTQRYADVIHIPGTICPASFSDPHEMGRMVIYSSETNNVVVHSVLSPTFQKVGSIEELRAMRTGYKRTEGPRAYVRCTVDRAHMAEATLVRAELAEVQPLIVVHVEARDSAAKESVREAARSVVAAGSDLSGYAALADVAKPGTSVGVMRRLVEYRKAVG